MPIKNALISRWEREIDYKFNESLRGIKWQDKNTPNAKLTSPPFGLTAQGKIDLRYFKLREGLKYQYFKEVDFSYFEFPPLNINEIKNRTAYITKNGGAGIIDSKFEDCVLFSAKIPPNMSGEFINCDFTKSKILNSRISGVFINCQFDNVIFDDVIFGKAEFRDCTFTKAKFKDCLLSNSRWENCIFEKTKFHKGIISKNDFNFSEFINSPLTEKQISDINSNIKIV